MDDCEASVDLITEINGRVSRWFIDYKMMGRDLLEHYDFLVNLFQS